MLTSFFDVCAKVLRVVAFLKICCKTCAKTPAFVDKNESKPKNISAISSKAANMNKRPAPQVKLSGDLTSYF